MTRAGARNTWTGVAINATLVVLKFAAGVFGHSQALIADAAHSLSDLFTDGIVLWGIHVGRRDADASHPYGHGRIETLAAALVGLCLVGVAAFLAIEPIGRLVRGETGVAPAGITVAAAALSIAAKEWLYRYTVRVGQQIKSQALIANAWHHRSDALSSVVVLLAVAGAQLGPAWRVLDAYAAIAVALLIMAIAVRILWDAGREMTDTAPTESVVEALRQVTLAIDGVSDVHGLKVRTAGPKLQIEIDIVVDGSITVAAGHHIAVQVKRALQSSGSDVGNVIVHVDPLPRDADDDDGDQRDD